MALLVGLGVDSAHVRRYRNEPVRLCTLHMHEKHGMRSMVTLNVLSDSGDQCLLHTIMLTSIMVSIGHTIPEISALDEYDCLEMNWYQCSAEAAYI